MWALVQINEKQATAARYQLKDLKNDENHCGGMRINTFSYKSK